MHIIKSKIKMFCVPKIEDSNNNNIIPRRNLSNRFLCNLRQNYENMKKLQNTKIGIAEQNENEMVEVCIDERPYSYVMLPRSRKILPGCDEEDISNVTIRRAYSINK